MSCYRAGSTSNRSDQIKPIVVTEQLRPFRRKVLYYPIAGVAPGVVGHFQFTLGGQSIVGESDLTYAVHKQIAFTVFPNDMTRVDTAVDVKVDRLTPLPR